MTKNIMIVGVGGQGSLLASKLLGNVLLDCGYSVKLSEVHGMSQRGGSVVTYVKYGDKVYSPIIDKGEADFIISFEALEAARWMSYLKKDGVIVSNKQQIYPMPVIIGAKQYPKGIVDKINSKVNAICIDALLLAKKAGNAKAVNTVLMGVLSTLMDISEEKWIQAINKTVPAKLLQVNLDAFRIGRGYKNELC